MQYNVYTKIDGELAKFVVKDSADPFVAIWAVRKSLNRDTGQGAVLAVVPKNPTQLELF